MEAKDISMGLKKAEHDLLEIYEKGTLSQKEEKELKNDFIIQTISKVKLQME